MIKIIAAYRYFSYFCRVRIISAIFFLLLVLFSQTPLQHLLKLPILFEHFVEHQAVSKDISFADFIKHHYFSGNPRDADYERDQQLPFRADSVLLISNTVVVPSHVAIEFQPVVHEGRIYPLLDIDKVISVYQFDIWQPPRIS